MRLAFVHLEAENGGPDEEVHVVVPGEEVAVAVPLDALGKLLPILAEATRELPEATCAACGEPLPTPDRARSRRTGPGR